MRNFESLNDALNFCKRCIFCNEKMAYRDLLVENIDEFVLNLSSSTPENISIARSSGIIKYNECQNFNHSFINKRLLANGIFYTSLAINCSSQECSRYHYIIRLCFNTNDKNNIQLISINLSMEFFSFEEDNEVFEIKNNYAVDKCYYIQHLSDGNTKNISLPILPIDHQKIDDLFFRVKRLASFV